MGAYARVELRLSGVVQGVGLRPWAAQRARARDLAGSIRNEAGAVWVALEGERAGIEAWLADLASGAPPGLTLAALERRETSPTGLAGFRIETSSRCGATAVVPPDIPVCRACVDEIYEPSDRRFGYAFTHCARCGPRASVLDALPWDRARTSLASFPLCPACAREYEDPGDRRHHAEGIACPDCGPRLWARGVDGRVLGGDPLTRALETLASGGIVALKGYGAYHLAVDAGNPRAVARLRQRKGRPSKPFAVLLPDLQCARRVALLGPQEEALLAGPLRPVVVAPRRMEGCEALGLAADVAPTTRDLGLLLPLAPLHHLLLRAPPGDGRERCAALVFTSANRSGEPTISDDAEAVDALGAVADLLLGHDRAVLRPCDDSVFRTSARGPIPIRLSRGKAPMGLRVPTGASAVLAIGADLKCAPALALGSDLVLEAHVGDLESVAAADLALERALGLCRTRGLRPDLVVHDLHPGYVGTRIAGELAAALGAETLGVQHHHAHGLAAAVDAGLLAPCLAIVLDGLGWGGDGTLWGGEILVLEGARMARAAHLETIRIQGGGAAAREPWRAAAAWLGRAFPDGAAPRLAFHARHGARDLALLAQATERGINAVETSSCGRLFDAVASLLDCGDRADFEGEAALALEALASSRPDAAKGAAADTALCRSELDGADVIACADLVRSLVCDGARGLPRAALAQRFHRSLALRIAARAAEVARLHGLSDVVLSGGCFQNRLLLAAIADAVATAGLVAHSHRRLPPNDGNLAVGQVAYGLRWLSSTRR